MANEFINVSVAVFLPVVVDAGAFLLVVYCVLWLFEAWDAVINLLGREQ